MPTLIAIAFAGFIAQLVDGSLGMGYGVTSTSLLLTLGLAPALASASVHLAEIGTSGVSGFSHWRLGNVNSRVLLTIGVPGGVGAFLGAVVYMVLEDYFSKLSPTFWQFGIGLVLVLAVLFTPRGVLGAFENFGRYFSERKKS